mmetsp:Transcript_26572/g.63131  ORF Transcript_26572/g.63131 Transcript_26572/m.63131 type:complete len:159 (-) Transcript_26572:15-491(-)
MDWFGSWCAPNKDNGVGMEPKEATQQHVPGGTLGFGLTNGAARPNSQSDKAGIGVILALSPDNSLYVHTVCPGGSAEGKLLPGDVLVKIGQEDVFCAPPGHVAELLLGRQGSIVEIWVRRPKNPNASELQFTTACVKVVRRRIDPFKSEPGRGRNLTE